MEPITTLASYVVPKVGDLLFKGATEQVKKTLNKTDIEKAIRLRHASRTQQV